jgi:antitoxin component YwqK of YwqJK toxin-antitoxin module
MKRVFATLLLTLSGATFPLVAAGQEAPVPPADLYESSADDRATGPRSAAAFGEPTPLAPDGGVPTPLEPSPNDHLPAPQRERATPVHRAPLRNAPAAARDERAPLPLNESFQTSSDGAAESKATSIPDAKAEDVPTELVTERYSNRMIKVERHVAQDSERNFINHGPWIMYSPDGTLIAKGRFEFGKRQGEWQRLYDAKDERVLGKLAKQFAPPFIGIATFVDGKLHGSWKIVDGQQRDVRSWEFKHGRPDGSAVTFYPNGRKQSEMTFVDATLDGAVTEWDSAGNVAKRIVYKDGRCTTPYLKKYPNGAKQHVGQYLGPKQMIKTDVDFWAGVVEPTIVKKEGKSKRHGNWLEYYEHGGKKFEGEFDEDQPIGMHIWWYSNGQKMAEGRFEAGKAHGHWTWWHENGQKQKDGSFQQGVQTGTWVHWKADGKVQEVQEHSLAPIAPQQAKPLANRSDLTRNDQPTSVIQTESAPPATSVPSSRRLRPVPMKH